MTKRLGADRVVPADLSEPPQGGTQSKGEITRYRKASEERIDSRRAMGSPFDRLRTGLAEHSTDDLDRDEGWEGGEPRPKGPTGGKAKPGITYRWRERRERR